MDLFYWCFLSKILFCMFKLPALSSQLSLESKVSQLSRRPRHLTSFSAAASKLVRNFVDCFELQLSFRSCSRKEEGEPRSGQFCFLGNLLLSLSLFLFLSVSLSLSSSCSLFHSLYFSWFLIRSLTFSLCFPHFCPSLSFSSTLTYSFSLIFHAHNSI